MKEVYNEKIGEIDVALAENGKRYILSIRKGEDEVTRYFKNKKSAENGLNDVLNFIHENQNFGLTEIGRYLNLYKIGDQYA
jgi:hypothetical protein